LTRQKDVALDSVVPVEVDLSKIVEILQTRITSLEETSNQQMQHLQTSLKADFQTEIADVRQLAESSIQQMQQLKASIKADETEIAEVRKLASNSGTSETVVNNLRDEVNEMNSSIRSIQSTVQKVQAHSAIAFKGKAGASSSYRYLPPESAFNKGTWANKANQFPAILWFKFDQPQIVTTIQIVSRPESRLLKQAPKKMEFLSSNDCKTWKSHGNVTVGFTKASFPWHFTMNSGREGHRCWGIRFYKNGDQHVAVHNVLMWC